MWIKLPVVQILPHLKKTRRKLTNLNLSLRLQYNILLVLDELNTCNDDELLQDV